MLQLTRPRLRDPRVVPTRPVRINRRHPLAAGLVFCMPGPGLVDLVGRVKGPSPLAANAVTVGDCGPVMGYANGANSFRSVTDAWVAGVVSDPVLGALGINGVPVTAMAGFVSAVSPANGQPQGSLSYGYNIYQQWQLKPENYNGNWRPYFSNRNSISPYLVSPGVLAAGESATVIGAFDGVGTCWVGSKRARGSYLAASGAMTPYVAPTSPGLGCSVQADASGFAFSVWAALLSPGLMEWAATLPFDMLEPDE